MSGNQTLVLASASAGRRGLMESIGLVPDVISPSDIDETPHKAEDPGLYVLRLACEKAAVAAQKHPNAYVVAADTIGACGTRILGKSETVEGAREMLQLLSGRRHRVYTGLCVVAPGGKKSAKTVLTTVKFKRLSDEELEAYLESGQWRGKSGCYGIQSRAGGFIESINGSFSNVVGLPLVELRNALKGLGFDEKAHLTSKA